MESAVENKTETTRVAKPKWIRVTLPTGQKYKQLRSLVDTYNLNTICPSGIDQHKRLFVVYGGFTPFNPL